jgi:hypothetical protein
MSGLPVVSAAAIIARVTPHGIKQEGTQKERRDRIGALICGGCNAMNFGGSIEK